MAEMVKMTKHITFMHPYIDYFRFFIFLIISVLNLLITIHSK